MSENLLSISVRELVEFVYTTGDLALGGVGSSRLLQGAEGHRQIQKKRKEDWQNEVFVKYSFQSADDTTVIITGRIDGVYISDDITIIEEIKTTLSNAELRPYRLSDFISEDFWLEHSDILSQYQSCFKGYSFIHWAQALVYGFLYLKTRQEALATNDGDEDITATNDGDEDITATINSSEIICRLNYLKLNTRTEKLVDVICSLDFLQAFFDHTISIWLKHHQEYNDWRQLSRASLLQLEFPLKFRTEQRKMAVAVYKSIAAGTNLYSRAPTGTGKTIATIFPALKAMGEGETQKIFYCTAKTIGRTVAESTIQLLQNSGAKIRYCVLTAKEKVCLKDFALCDPEWCEYAKGYYDKQKEALPNALTYSYWNYDIIKTIALKYTICPFELSLTLSQYAEIVICDYNYCFDPIILLRRHFDGEKHTYTFLIDEAHNLVDRAREMYSNELSTPVLSQWIQTFPNKKLKIHKTLIALKKDLEIIEPLDKHFFVLSEFPEKITKYVNSLLLMIEKQLEKKNKPFTKFYLLKIYFELLFFQNDVRSITDNHIIYYQRNLPVGANDYSSLHTNQPYYLLKIFCINPRDLFAIYLKNAKSAIFFSATLHPFDYFCEILAEKDDDHRLTLLSPFDSDRFGLYVYTGINIYYKYREQAYQPLADLINSICRLKQGNYLIYFPSFSFMNAVYNLLIGRDTLDDVCENTSSPTILRQTPNMTEQDRETFLSKFEATDQTLIAFAVLGGIFGEGIDLIGDKLIGCMIVSVGLPSLGDEKGLIKDYYDDKMNMGFEYAYRYPGFNKVMQAAGRVIRSEEDKGFVILIDQRYINPEYKSLYPPDWQHYKVYSHIKNLELEIKKFWGDNMI